MRRMRNYFCLRSRVFSSSWYLPSCQPFVRLYHCFLLSLSLIHIKKESPPSIVSLLCLSRAASKSVLFFSVVHLYHASLCRIGHFNPLVCLRGERFPVCFCRSGAIHVIYWTPSNRARCWQNYQQNHSEQRSENIPINAPYWLFKEEGAAVDVGRFAEREIWWDERDLGRIYLGITRQAHNVVG